jgi:bifunctional DNase/RNase
MENGSSLVEVKIGALIMDPNTNTPIVVLKGVDSETVLPIWVGAFEANAIALEIEKVVPQRPMTHDLLRNVIVECRLSASSVVITDLLDNTFYARIELKDQNEEPVMLDARPSDAIALALRLDCPIFVEQKVIDLSASSTQTDPEPDESTPVTEDWPDLIG